MTTSIFTSLVDRHLTLIMKTKQIFELAIRLLGLVFLYHGLMGLPEHLGVLLQMLVQLSAAGFVLGVVGVLWPFAVAYWLVRGAPFLMRSAYPSPSAEPEPPAPLVVAMAQSPDA